MTNKQFLFALAILAWLISFCVLAVTATVGGAYIATLEDGNPNALEHVMYCILTVAVLSAMGISKIMTLSHDVKISKKAGEQ